MVWPFIKGGCEKVLKVLWRSRWYNGTLKNRNQNFLLSPHYAGLNDLGKRTGRYACGLSTSWLSNNGWVSPLPPVLFLLVWVTSPPYLPLCSASQAVQAAMQWTWSKSWSICKTTRQNKWLFADGSTPSIIRHSSAQKDLTAQWKKKCSDMNGKPGAVKLAVALKKYTQQQLKHQMDKKACTVTQIQVLQLWSNSLITHQVQPRSHLWRSLSLLWLPVPQGGWSSCFWVELKANSTTATGAKMMLERKGI